MATVFFSALKFTRGAAVRAETAAEVVAEGFLVAATLVAPTLRAAAASGQAMTAVVLGALAVAMLLLATARHLV